MSILGAQLPAGKLLWKSRSHSPKPTCVYLPVLLRSWGVQMHGQDHHHLGAGVHENTQDWLNGESVRRGFGQGMQGEALRDGAEVPEAQCRENWGGWVEAHAAANPLNPWILSPGCLFSNLITQEGQGIETWEPCYLSTVTGHWIRPLPLSSDLLSSSVQWPLWYAHLQEQEEGRGYNGMLWKTVIRVFLRETKTPSSLACPCYHNCNGE